VLSGTPVGPGPLSRQQLDRSITQHQPELLTCYRRELGQNPALQGRLVLLFAIAPSGAVPWARAVDSTLRSPALETCVAQRALKWRFPAARAGTPHVSVRFTFRTTP
jgi:TonB family protein